VNPGVTHVIVNNVSSERNIPNLYVMPGSMYVGGLRVELEGPEHIAFQSDYLQNTLTTDIPSDLSSSATILRQFFFLNVWEQCVTAVEDEEFLERALGGPDTSVRVRRMRRVEYLLANEGEDCRTALERALEEIHDGFGEFIPATGELRSFGLLRIDFTEGDAEDTCAPCHPDPTGRYLGAENQAIRIMLADSGHFVWAYDNASPLYRVTVSGVSDNITEDPLVTMLTQPKDEEHWPLANRVVEIIPWSAILENGEKVADEIGVFCRVSIPYSPDAKVESGDPPKTFRIDSGTGHEEAMTALNELIHAWDDNHPRKDELNSGDGLRHFYVRFWHEVATATTPVLIPNGSGLPLGTTGLIPTFIQSGIRGDYWIVALRPETPDRTVPFDLHTAPDGVPPHGPRHFFSPLALIQSADNETKAVEDCRKHIVPVTDTGCCTVIVGDGIHSFGHFTSIQAAVNALPPQGGKVCVREGVYEEFVEIGGRTNVTIEGCGERTIVATPAGGGGDVFHVGAGPLTVSFTTIRSLQIRATGQAISLGGSNNVRLIDLLIVEQPTESPSDGPIVTFAGSSNLEMRSCRIETTHRRAISTGGGENYLFEDVSIVDVGSPAFPTSLIELSGPRDFVFRNCTIVANGRFGLSSGGPVRVRVEGCKITGLGTGENRARSAILFQGPDDVEIANCAFKCESLSEDAVLAFTFPQQGGITVRNCTIQADTLFWGGIHVFGGRSIRFLDNKIRGGAGHGITLGGVQWVADDGSGNVRSTEGPGRAQLGVTGTITGDLRSGFQDINPSTGLLAHYSASMFTAFGSQQLLNEDVLISGNLIENMGGNGISDITVLGVPAAQPLVTGRRMRIERNRIRNCLIGPLIGDMAIVDEALPVGGSIEGADDGDGIRLPVLPYGGIVLANANEHCHICDNVITNNGKDVVIEIPNSPPEPTLPPFNGIFVLIGESIVISGNHVSENGVLFESAFKLVTGVRAGIAVMHATTGVPDAVTNLLDPFVRNPGAENTYGREQFNMALRVAGNTVVHPEGRALYVCSSGSVIVEGNYLASRGSHATDSPPDRNAIGDAVYVHNLGRPWEAANPAVDTLNGTFPALAQNYIEFGTVNGSPIFAGGNAFVTGLGGHTLFNNNQVVYDWSVQEFFSDPGTPLSYFPVGVISTDHVGMHGNNFAFRLFLPGQASPPEVTLPVGYEDQVLLTNVFVLGATVDVTGNRASERADEYDSSLTSMMTIGLLMNTTAHNQGTRCILAFQGNEPGEEQASWLTDGPNLVLLIPGGAGCAGLKTSINPVMTRLLALILDRR
jgi:hypothetical protein